MIFRLPLLLCLCYSKNRACNIKIIDKQKARPSFYRKKHLLCGTVYVFWKAILLIITMNAFFVGLLRDLSIPVGETSKSKDIKIKSKPDGNGRKLLMEHLT